MINGLGYKLANVPTVTGLSSVVADSIISGSTNTGQLILNGIDVSTTLTQVPINTNNITLLQQATTGITYDNTGGIDLTTISNNVTTGANSIKTSYVPIANNDVANKLYTDTKIANLVASAPATLDTLNELAVALGNDPNYATSTATLIGGKASLTANQTISGINTLSNTSNVYYGDGSHLTGVSSTLPANALTTNTAQTITSTGSKTFENCAIVMSDGGAGGAGLLTTTLKQSPLSNMFELTQNANNNGFIFYDSVGANTIIEGGTVYAKNLTIADASNPTKFIQHTMTANAYLIDNPNTSGTIALKVKDSVGNYTFQPAFTLDSNALTLGLKLKMYNQDMTSTIDGTLYRNLNVQTSSIYNSKATLIGFIPTGILNVLVLTTSYVSYQNIQIQGDQIKGPTSNNLYIVSTAMRYNGLSVSNTVNTTTVFINGTVAWPIGTHFTTTANYIGHYITAILGGGNYTVAPPLAGLNALHAESIQWLPLNRSYANATTSGNIYFDTTTGIDFKHENTNLGTTWKSMVLDENQITAWKPIVQQDYLYGRVDGVAFNLGLNGNYPIGYSFTYVSSTPPGITFTTGVSANYTTTSIPIGVWMVNGGAVITRGTGTFAVTSYTQIVATIATGTGVIRTLAMVTPIPNGYTGFQLVAPMSGITLTCQTVCTVNFANVSSMTVGTATRYNNFTFTKIA
jgi:hypothetical protein